MKSLVSIAYIMLLFGVASCGSRAGKGDYPSQNITIICPWSPGGGTDRVSRFFAGELDKMFGPAAVVMNRTGGGGSVGHTAGAMAKPDGLTITMGTFELSTMHWMGISPLSYEDFRPVMQVNADPAALFVRAESTWQTVTDLIEAAKAVPGSVKMSGTARGGAWDLARAGFQLAAGLSVNDILWVPSEGSAPSLVELLGGHIDVVCCSLPEAFSQVESGQLRPLAVMADERLAEFPKVPTVKENGIPWSAVGWRGFLLPKKTPPEIVAKVTDAIRSIAESEAYDDFLKKNRFGLALRHGEDFRAFLEQQDGQWRQVIDAAQYESADPGPYVVPMFLIAGILVLGVWQGLASRRDERVSPEPVDWKKACLFLGGLFGYLLAIPVLGFLVATLVTAIGLLRWFGGKWVEAAVVSTLLCAAVYLLFVHLFKVTLPQGMLGLPI